MVSERGECQYAFEIHDVGRRAPRTLLSPSDSRNQGLGNSPYVSEDAQPGQRVQLTVAFVSTREMAFKDDKRVEVSLEALFPAA